MMLALILKRTNRPLKKSIVTRGARGMKIADIKKFVPRLDHLTRNIYTLERASIGQGFFSLDNEIDGIVRRIPVLFTYKKELYTALSVEMLRVLFGKPSIAGFVSPLGMVKLAITPKFIMPTDKRGNVWPYFSKQDPGKYIPAVDVINMRSLPKDKQKELIKKIRGRMMIVGTSAVGLKDIRATPIDARFPGVEVHAQVIESAARRLYLSRPNYMHGGEVLILLIVGLLMIWLVPKIGAKWTLLLFAFMAGGSVGGSWYLFTEHRILFDPCLSGLHPHPLGLEWAQTGYRGARHGCSRPRRSPIPAFATRVPATFPR